MKGFLKFLLFFATLFVLLMAFSEAFRDYIKSIRIIFKTKEPDWFEDEYECVIEEDDETPNVSTEGSSNSKTNDEAELTSEELEDTVKKSVKSQKVVG